MKLIFSIACGWVYGLVSYSRMQLHIGPFTHFSSVFNDIIQYLISCVKAFGVGGFSYLGATCIAFYKKKFDMWSKHKKSKKETL